jgi:hypothetical protein
MKEKPKEKAPPKRFTHTPARSPLVKQRHRIGGARDEGPYASEQQQVAD